MNEHNTAQVREQAEDIYHTESSRVLATLIRLLGDFDLAEDALHEAFRIALEQWPRDGIPANPRAWLVSTGRFKAIDALRRHARYDTSLEDVAERLVDISADHRIRVWAMMETPLAMLNARDIAAAGQPRSVPGRRPPQFAKRERG